MVTPSSDTLLEMITVDLINVEAVKKLMVQDDLSCAAFGRRLGVSRSLVSRILSGSREPSSRFIVRFKEAYPNLSIERYFFTPSVTHECHRTGTDNS